jgi:acyl-CoA dehydrogenase
MNFDLTDEQKQLQDEVRRLLAARVTRPLLLCLVDNKQDWSPELWSEVAGMGLLGSAIPQAYGGLGLGRIEQCVVAGEMGRAVAPIPFFSSACLAVEALLLAGTEAQKARWLPKIASGETVATFAWNEGRGAAGARPAETTFRQGRLSGSKSPVSDAGVAALGIVAAEGADGPALALVALDQAAVSRTRLEGFEQLRPHYRLDFRGAAAEPMPVADAGAILEVLYHRAAVYSAFEQIGGAEAALYMARDYTLQRKIFARPLASFQAVKHNLANIYALIQLARANAYFAAWALENDAPEFASAAAAAWLSATRAYEQAARENMQMHGGVSYTTDVDCHFHFRRARLLALNLGSAEVWSDRLIAALEDRAA